MVVGLFSEAGRNKLLRRAHELTETVFAKVSICPDLTRRQREKEGNIWEEAERRKGSLTEDDRAKNLRWAVVEGKGER